MKNSKCLLLVLVSTLLLLGVGTVSALDARIDWDPNPLVIEGLSPGDEASYSVTLTNSGSLPIPAAYQLRIEAQGGIAQYLTIEQPEFPRIFKRGQEVTFSVDVSVPPDAPTGTVEGTLALKRVTGKRVLDVWQAEALPVSIQIVEPELAAPTDPQVLELDTGTDTILVSTQVYEGKIDFPLGAEPALSALHVEGGFSGASLLTADGRFTVRMNVEATGLLRVVDGDGNGYLMKLFPKAPEIVEVNPIIDAKSTAIALLAVQPGVITADPYIDAAILAILAQLPEIDVLAEQIYQELQRGTFHFNENLSGEVLQALHDASYALANVSLEDLQAANLSAKIKALVARLLEAFLPPAFAEITFADPCTDVASDQFTPTVGNPDDVCIGADIADAPQDSLFYMSNPRSRWVALTADLSGFGGDPFEVFDRIPSRHFDFPNLLQTLKIGAQTAWDVLVDMFTNEYNATGKLEARMDDWFGPAQSIGSYAFPQNGPYIVSTVGFAKDRDDSTPGRLYRESLLFTSITEFVAPLASVLADLDVLEAGQVLDGPVEEKLMTCAEANDAWTFATVESLVTLVESEGGTLDFIDWMANSFLFDEGAWSYFLCISEPAAAALVTATNAKKLITEMLGSAAAFVTYASAGLETFGNFAAMYDTFTDASLASLDNYAVTVGSWISVNTPPSAVDDSAFAESGVPVTIDVLGNDSDADGDPITITSVTNGEHGTVTHDGSSVVYTSDPGFSGGDTFAYTISDGVDSAEAHVTVTVSYVPPNQAPIAADDSAAAQSGVAVDIAVLTNDTDPDGDPLTVTAVGMAANGSVINNGDSVTYTSNSGFAGSDTFSYIVSDGRGGSDSAVVTVAVSAVTPPTTFDIDPKNTTIGEAAGSVTFTVMRSDGTLAETVYVTTTQNQGSSNSGDYVEKLSESLPFAVGETQQTVAVTIIDDTEAEGDETFGLMVQESASAPLDTYLASATFTITDNDGVPAVGQPLNDTGITLCADATSSSLPCPVDGFPGQDAEYGRDVTHNDDSDGHAGFSFTKFDVNGNPLAIQNGTWDEAGSEAAGTKWSCVQDNVTGRVWEVKTDDGGLRDKDWTYSWYNPDASTNGGVAGYEDGGNNCSDSIRCDTHKYAADVNALGLCGANDWRLPDVRELLSIVNNERYGPAIDLPWFPNTQSSGWFWSSSTDAFDPKYAWCIYFSAGDVYSQGKYATMYVRLVRGGQ